MMNPFVLSLIFAISTALLLQFSLIPLSYAQRDFRGLLWKQLKHSWLLTIVRMITNKYFWMFVLILVATGVTGFYMAWYAVDTTGIIIITPFLIFILIFALTTKLSEKYSIPRSKIRENIAKRPAIKFISSKINDEFSILESGFNEVYRLLDLNLSEPIGLIKTRFATPGPKYPAAYLWDSAFISGAWRLWDEKIAQDIMKPFLDTQKDDGFCTQTIPLGLAINENISNPPLIAWALCESADMTGTYEEIGQYYDKIKKFSTYMYENRKSGDLFCWKHSYESGIDNSPRFTDRAETAQYDLEHMWAVDLNCWIMLQNQSLIKIADFLGKHDDVEEFKNKNKRLCEVINQYLWNEEAGYYFDYNFDKNEQIEIPTVVSFFPMLVGCTDDKKNQKLLHHIRSKEEFGTLVPFPTVARNDENFLKDMWRGPVWMNTAYTCIKGLEKIGEDELAGELSYRLFKAVAYTYDNCGSIYEFYDVDRYDLEELSRKKGNFWKKVTLGDKPVKKFVGWTGLVNTLLIENVIGYKKRNGITTITPHLPVIFQDAKIVVEIPQFNETLKLEWSKDIIKGVLIANDDGEETVKEFEGNNHEALLSSS